jgi:catechol 1,2-dioxygenase
LAACDERTIDRRSLLCWLAAGTVGAAFAACDSQGTLVVNDGTRGGDDGGLDGGPLGDDADASDSADADPDASCGARAGCSVTEDNILGPFYKPGAPIFTGKLAPDGLPGTRLHLSGTVYAADCTTPLAGAVLDIWQADSTGAYDASGYLLRGKLVADACGRWSFETILPGHYLNGSQYRPAHIHFTITHPSATSLTTQLYFQGDPYNSIDPYIKQSLIIELVQESGYRRGVWDVVLS